VPLSLGLLASAASVRGHDNKARRQCCINQNCLHHLLAVSPPCTLYQTHDGRLLRYLVRFLFPYQNISSSTHVPSNTMPSRARQLTSLSLQPHRQPSRRRLHDPRRNRALLPARPVRPSSHIFRRIAARSSITRHATEKVKILIET
jgi:hypothetical protein